VIIERDKAVTGPLSQEAKGAFQMRLARHYFMQLMNGIDYIHDKMTSHRDIKPDNIMLDKWLTLKIGDFGFARAGDETKGFRSVLVTKLGTPEYRSPDIYIDTPGSNVGGTGLLHAPLSPALFLFRWRCSVFLSPALSPSPHLPPSPFAHAHTRVFSQQPTPLTITLPCRVGAAQITIPALRTSGPAV
jgi:serine/threonine protein kinase